MNTAAAILLTGSMLLAPPAPTPGPAREGTGDRRAALDAMEFKPLPAAAWSTLDGWTDGKAFTPAQADGRVVLIGTFADFNRASLDAVTMMQSMGEKFGKQGLMVVGVHADKGWAEAPRFLADAKAAFPVAHDTGNKFRAAIMSDEDPDFYLIDRAGNLRFADLETAAVESAVAAAVAESRDDALKAAAAPRETARPAASAPGEVSFPMPDAAAYKAAKWPERNPAVGPAKDHQGKQLLSSFGKETWLTEKPALGGRVVVVDFWATWCGPCRMAMPKLDELYNAHKADLVIMGVSDEKDDKVKAFLSSHKHAYPQALDPKQTVYKLLKIQGIPHVVVMSTDGVVRWQGNPLDGKFPAAVEAAIKADPGVEARRKAEGAA